MTSCERCQSIHDGSFGSGRFCSMKCSRSFSTSRNREEINRKVSKSLTKYLIPHLRRTTTITCRFCFCTKEVRADKKDKQKYCSSRCVNQTNRGLQRELAKQRLATTDKPKRSRNEILFFDLTKQKFGDALANPSMFDGWDADVVIPSRKIAVLWNGPWHHRKLFEGHHLEQVQNRDKIKLDRIRAHGFTPYIVKDDGSYDPKFVVEQFSRFETIIAGM